MEVVDKICDELLIHSQVEEEIFYPTVREADRALAGQARAIPRADFLFASADDRRVIFLPSRAF